jgi:hypothetical protein
MSGRLNHLPLDQTRMVERSESISMCAKLSLVRILNLGTMWAGWRSWYEMDDGHANSAGPIGFDYGHFFRWPRLTLARRQSRSTSQWQPYHNASG